LSFIIGALGAGLVLRASGKTRYSLRAYLFSSPFYLVFTFFAIKYYGTWGAITSAMLGIILPKAFQIFFEMRLLKMSFIKYLPWKMLARIVATSFLFIIPVFLLDVFLTLHWSIVMLLSIIYVLAVYYYELKLGVFIVSEENLRKTVASFVSKFRKNNN
jgi:O-antigen/teichoic acid export membrane protein